MFFIINTMKKQIILLSSILIIGLASCGKTPTFSSGEPSKTVEESSTKTEESVVESSIESTSEDQSSEEQSSSKSQTSSKTSSSTSNTPITGELVLRNSYGMVVKFDKKGAKIDSITLDGKKVGQNGFIAGRVANRIAGASFELDGTTYNINKNDGNNTLHGGSQGFGEINWNVDSLTDASISFSLFSKDGDMGFPGNMNVTTTYTLGEEGQLTYVIKAISDKKTIFNPINHLYMNLNGNTSVSNHSLWIDGDKYLSIDSSKIPTGEIKDVSNRASMDYTTKKAYQSGNDRCLVLNGEGYRKVAELNGTTTGYKMELYTDRPALQLYDNNQYICLEAQDYIDAIHHDNFPSIVLNANEEWYSKSAYCFSK